MFILTILENYNNDNIVKIEYIDGEEIITTIRVMDINELISWLDDSKKSNQFKIKFENTIEIKIISMYSFEGEIDIMINTYTYNEQGEEYYKDELLKTYKRYNNALNYAKEQIKYIDNCYSMVVIE